MEIQKNIPLSKYSQIKIGGPAENFVVAKTKKELIEAIQYGKSHNLEITILGWGSNVLISDNGIKGLVIVNKCSEMRILDSNGKNPKIELTETEEETLARLDQLDGEKYGSFDDLNYDETSLPTSKVYMDSGMSLPLAILKTIKADLTGLQWYGGIPGTIGGSIYNNIHGGTHFIFEVLNEVEVMDKNTLEIRNLKVSELEGGYDTSIFHKTNDYILSAIFNLYHGDSAKALKVMQEWRMRKKIQPQVSSGCMWMNISNEDKEKLNIPSTSAGYIIEHLLKLKGETKGDAIISDKHAAFIENLNKASSDDVLHLMKKIYNKAQSEFGIILKPEIFLLGFQKEEIKEFIR